MNKLAKGSLAILLAAALLISGCVVPAWVGQVGTIINALAPAVINILQIVAIAEGKTYNAALGNRITTDAANVKTLSNDFVRASATAAPGVCMQLQASLNAFSQDQQEVLAVIRVSSPAAQAKAGLLFTLTVAAFGTVAALVPSCNNPVQLRVNLSKSSLAIDGNGFMSAYNAALVLSSGNAAVDAYTKSHKIHGHGWAVRTLSLGFQK